MSNQPTISYATQDDVPVILDLIKELADYEKASSSVLATVESLTKTLSLAPNPSTPPPSSAPGYAKTLLLRTPQSQGSEVAGMALYFNNYSTWRAAPGVYLEDLFVRPQYRKMGYGTLLIKALAKEVKRIEGGRLEWSCLRWNEPSLKFYRSLGAKEMEEWVGLRVDGEALDRLAGEVEKEADVKV
ncbi:Peroxygenase 1 [Taxawa tesnikishii (nom. ined.)]|nr:Peroxygenase 1 [Dothideales sp. JES 119]